MTQGYKLSTLSLARVRQKYAFLLPFSKEEGFATFPLARARRTTWTVCNLGCNCRHSAPCTRAPHAHARRRDNVDSLQSSTVSTLQPGCITPPHARDALSARLCGCARHGDPSPGMREPRSRLVLVPLCPHPMRTCPCPWPPARTRRPFNLGSQNEDHHMQNT
jgi:hypothetical protein